MIPIDVEALVLADALGALDADEREVLTTRLTVLSYAERMRVAELYDVVVILAEAVTPVAPPARVRARLMAATIARRSDPRRDAPRSDAHRPPGLEERETE